MDLRWEHLPKTFTIFFCFSTLSLLMLLLPEPAVGIGHLPKSRTQKHHEHELKEEAILEAKIEQKHEAEKNAEELAAWKAEQKLWKQQRRKMRDQYLEKQRRIKEEQDRAAAIAKAKAEAELLRQQKLKDAQKQKEKLQKEKNNQQNNYPQLPPGSIRGGIQDCFGVPGGLAKEDACGVCGGDNSSCADCRGVPYGPAKQDCVGLCEGDDFSCMDCAGTMNGDAEYDICGVCNGNGTTCLDCLGVVNGTARRDVCGICNGDGTTCLDCHGVANGDARFDPCGICEGDGTTCCSPINNNKDFPVTSNSGASSLKISGIDGNGGNAALCSGHGTCSYAHHCCLCDAGWTGPFCSIQQNLCVEHQDAYLETVNFDAIDNNDKAQQKQNQELCNGRGACDPLTAVCRCFEPWNWIGPACETSTCTNFRGSYIVEQGRCICKHGYGGRFCERCVAMRPSRGKVHLCLEVIDSFISVPRSLWLEKSILLKEEDPKAPVFTLIDTTRNEAKSAVAGYSSLNIIEGNPTKRRDAIYPNSTHPASGYYYDCACRISAPPSDDNNNNNLAFDERYDKKNENPMLMNFNMSRAFLEDGIVPPGVPYTYRPVYTKMNKIHPLFDERIDGIMSQSDKKKALAKMKREALIEHTLSPRAPATLSQCQTLLQDVLTEFGYSINAATADVTELSSAIGSVSTGCGTQSSFCAAYFLISIVLLLILAVVIIICFYATGRYVQVSSPFAGEI